VLRREGWDVTISITERAGHAADVAREAAAQLVDVVVANGGDGTINEVVNGLAGSDTALAVLPGGTANVWAKEIRVSKNAAKAMRIVLSGRRERIDLGVANGRRFLLMAGVGLDAAIIPRVNPWLKRRAGALAYILAGAVTAIQTRPWDAEMNLDGAPANTQLYWLVAGNTRNYGGLVHITRCARARDGRLDGVLMRRGGMHLIPDGVRLLFGRHEKSPNISYRVAREISIETSGIPFQLDGDRCGETPVRLSVEPAALTVIVPQGLRSPLFAAAD
jgi:YegS/Rv2252/BmrU family lipid kinase